MATQPEPGIKRELSLGEILSKTFELYKRGFTKYFLLFAIVGVITNVAVKLVQQAFPFPILPPNPTPQQLSSYLGGLYAALFLQLGVIFAITVLLSPIAQGSAVELASEQIRTGQAGLGRSVRFALSRLPSIWALNLIVGIIVFLGFIALIIPGIILAIMFSLALPVLLIEGRGPLDSMGRSRVLVSHRWLNTFATFLVIGLIAGIALLIIGAVTGLFGLAGAVANGILSGLFQPLFPILLAVYYYSNLARMNSPSPASLGPDAYEWWNSNGPDANEWNGTGSDTNEWNNNRSDWNDTMPHLWHASRLLGRLLPQVRDKDQPRLDTALSIF